MEDVLEELRERTLELAVPLELPDEDTLVEIEEQILISIPYEFREFLLLVSDVVYGAMEPVTVTDPHSHTYLPEVAATAWSIGLPRELVPLCEYQGKYYGVSEDGEVALWADGELTEENWPSVWFWARDIWLES